jgi:hypothetical protein
MDIGCRGMVSGALVGVRGPLRLLGDADGPVELVQ